MPYGPATIPHLPPVWTGLYPYPKRSRQRWEIRHGAGTLDISIRYARNVCWNFPDGTTSTAARPSKVVGAGTTLVTCDDFAERGVEVQIHNNVATLTPEELPDLRWYLRLDSGTNITGSFASLPQGVSNYLYINNTAGLTGYTYQLPRATGTLALYSLAGLVGQIADLPRVTNTVVLDTLANVVGLSSDLPRISSKLYLTTLAGLTGTFSGLPLVTSDLYMYNITGLSGSTADLPRVSVYLYIFNATGMTGAFADLPRVTSSVSLLTLPGLSGPTSDIPRASDAVFLFNLSGLVGDVANLPLNTGERRCYSCANVTGDLPVVGTNTPIYFRTNAAVSPAEYDQTIANCVAAGGTNRTLFISSRHTAAALADIATLVGRGWTVNDSTA